jgi:tyrosinase
VVSFELSVRGSSDAAARYLTWAPTSAQVRAVGAAAAAGPVSLVLRTAAGAGGKLAFRTAPTDDAATELTLQVAADGTPSDFLVSGLFQSPSSDDHDAVLELVVGGQVVQSVPFMVRIRKNAESLSEDERDRFLDALARLNGQGHGVFALFRAMHTDQTSPQAHGDDGFFPWHRAYLLDLERELQKLDPAVTLPYWQFDDPAPNLFSEDFFGARDQSGIARLSAGNPLISWVTDNGQVSIMRLPNFDPTTSGANITRHEATVVGTQAAYHSFRNTREIDPHGHAHTSFSGDIHAIDTAAKDPLFFLLHCNVDRLWAKWQWFHQRFDVTQEGTYHFRGAFGDPGSTDAGHNLHDTMWPWNNVTNVDGRPPTAPRHPFQAATPAAGPPLEPTVADLIDFQGHLAGTALGFDYDDVPYESVG